jgi:hypothetical protein
MEIIYMNFTFEVILYPFITFWLECVATTLKRVTDRHSNQKVIKGYNNMSE